MPNILDEAVIPFLKEVDIPHRRDESIVVTDFRHSGFCHELMIHEFVQGQIVSLAEDVCQVPESPERLQDMASQLNCLGPGKYIVGSTGKLVFFFDHFWTSQPSIAEFRLLFDAVLDIIESRHGIVMRMAWGGMSIEEAIECHSKRPSKGQNAERQAEAIVRKAFKEKSTETKRDKPETNDAPSTSRRYRVVLRAVTNEIAAIKALREVMKDSLSAAKERLDCMPCTVAETEDRAIADEAKKQLEDAGCTVVVM